MTTRKMLETDAKIRLQNAGFIVRFKGYRMNVYVGSVLAQSFLCKSGSVNAEIVESLIAEKNR